MLSREGRFVVAVDVVLEFSYMCFAFICNKRTRFNVSLFRVVLLCCVFVSAFYSIGVSVLGRCLFVCFGQVLSRNASKTYDSV